MSVSLKPVSLISDARRAANLKAEMDAKAGQVWLESLTEGSYRKVSNRAGQAHYILSEGTVTYVNRRGEEAPATAIEFRRAYRAGYRRLNYVPKTAN
jgi:hypothetical protein